MRRSVAVALAVALASCSSGGDDATTTTVAVTTASTVAATTAAATSTSPSAPDTVAADTSTSTTPTTSTTSTTQPPPPEPPTIDELLALGRPIVLAHGGGEDVYPHSTLYAYGESVRDGVDVLDLDVQLSADGVLVVIHDASVDRTTDGTGRVDSMTYDELFALDAAYDFVPRGEEEPPLRGVRTGDHEPPDGYDPDDFAIPRFRDVAERFPELPLNVEVKGQGDAGLAAARVLATELTELGREDSTVVTSFDDMAMTEFVAAARVEVTPGLGASAAWVLQSTPLPSGMRILQLPIEFDGIQVITPELIERSHAAGYVIWVWPDDPQWEDLEGYRELLAMGLDGLNINVPADGVAAVAELAAT